jgi:hypothetical protein
MEILPALKALYRREVDGEGGRYLSIHSFHRCLSTFGPPATSASTSTPSSASSTTTTVSPLPLPTRGETVSSSKLNEALTTDVSVDPTSKRTTDAADRLVDRARRQLVARLVVRVYGTRPLSVFGTVTWSGFQVVFWGYVSLRRGDSSSSSL